MLRRFIAALPFVAAAVMASCSSSSSSAPPNVKSCVILGCSGGAPNCSVQGTCGGVGYHLDCDSSTGCTCSAYGDAGKVIGKTFAFKSDFCPWGDGDTCGAPFTSTLDQGFAAANVACGWGLQ